MHNQPMDRYCEEDATVICKKCCTPHHDDHTVVMVAEKVRTYVHTYVQSQLFSPAAFVSQ